MMLYCKHQIKQSSWYFFPVCVYVFDQHDMEWSYQCDFVFQHYTLHVLLYQDDFTEVLLVCSGTAWLTCAATVFICAPMWYLNLLESLLIFCLGTNWSAKTWYIPFAMRMHNNKAENSTTLSMYMYKYKVFIALRRLFQMSMGFAYEYSYIIFISKTHNDLFHGSHILKGTFVGNFVNC